MKLDYLIFDVYATARKVLFCLTCLLCLAPLKGQNGDDRGNLRAQARAALGAENLEALRNINFTVNTQQGELRQSARVALNGKQRVAVLLATQADSLVYVKNGESYFARTTQGVFDLSDEHIQGQIDQYLTWIDLINVLK